MAGQPAENGEFALVARVESAERSAGGARRHEIWGHRRVQPGAGCHLD